MDGSIFTNFVRAPLGVFNFLGPVVVLLWSSSVFDVVLVLVAGRLVATGVSLTQCAREVPSLLSHLSFERNGLSYLLSSGGWMTVSNVISPLLSIVDRFLIGAMVSVGAIALYTTPYEMAAKLQIVPGALVRVLFPSFSFDLTVVKYRRGGSSSRSNSSA